MGKPNSQVKQVYFSTIQDMVAGKVSPKAAIEHIEQAYQSGGQKG